MRQSTLISFTPAGHQQRHGLARHPLLVGTPGVALGLTEAGEEGVAPSQGREVKVEAILVVGRATLPPVPRVPLSDRLRRHRDEGVMDWT